MRGAGRVVFAAFLLIIVGMINIIYGIGALDDAEHLRQRPEVRTRQPQHPRLGSDHPRGDPAHRRLLADCRRDLRAGDRDRSAAALVRSGPCCRSAGPTRGGRSPSSPSACTSSTASSSSARKREPPEPPEPELTVAGARLGGGLPLIRDYSDEAETPAPPAGEGSRRPPRPAPRARRSPGPVRGC